MTKRSLIPWRVSRLYNDIFRLVNTTGIQAMHSTASLFRNRMVAEQALKQKLVSILIPTLARDHHASRLATLKQLLSKHLPAQSHQYYEAIVYCDGRNTAVENMIKALDDPRIRLLWTTKATKSAWGHPQTRLGIDVAQGDYFVRINDDDYPYAGYLQTLLNGFSDDTGISYARVVFKGEARKAYSYLLHGSYVIPRDRHGVLENRNIDCLCFMVRMDLARQYRDFWGDMYAADWRFLEKMLADGITATYTNRLIADKY